MCTVSRLTGGKQGSKAVKILYHNDREAYVETLMMAPNTGEN